MNARLPSRPREAHLRLQKPQPPEYPPRLPTGPNSGTLFGRGDIGYTILLWDNITNTAFSPYPCHGPNAVFVMLTDSTLHRMKVAVMLGNTSCSWHIQLALNSFPGAQANGRPAYICRTCLWALDAYEKYDVIQIFSAASY